MDEASRTVLPQKEFLLKHYMQWNDTLAHELGEKGLLTDDHLTKIKNLDDDTRKTSLLLDRISTQGPAQELDTLARSLADTRHSFDPEWINSWVSDELIQELAAERGQLQVDEQLLSEAATVVHREYGHFKRLSEQEKKAVVNLISRCTQVTKNIWAQRLETTCVDAQAEKEAYDARDERAELLGDQSSQYVLDNGGRVPKGKVTLQRTTSQSALLASQQNGPRDMFTSLRDGIQGIKTILGDSLLAAEALDDDRIRVLRAMGLSDKQIVHALLDAEIRRALDENAAQMAAAHARLIDRSRECEELEREIREHHAHHAQRLAAKDKNIHMLEMEVQRARDKAHELSPEVKALMKELRISKHELEEWRDWYQSIENSKRLNAIYQRDLPRIKAKPGALLDEEDAERKGVNSDPSLTNPNASLSSRTSGLSSSRAGAGAPSGGKEGGLTPRRRKGQASKREPLPRVNNGKKPIFRC